MGRAALPRMRRPGEKRTAGVAGVQPAVVVESGGSRRADFEIGDRSEKTFWRLYERLPEAKLYRRMVTRCTADWLRIGIGWAKMAR